MSGSARIDDLKQKFDENPGRYFAALANAYRKSGDLDRAIALCEEHLSTHPQHLSGYVVLGKSLFARGDREGARGAFERALKVDTDNVDALHQLALLARDEGRGSDALEYARRALAVDPLDPELLAMASDLSAPPEEDVAPPSFDPRSMFDEFAAPERVASTNPMSRPRAVDELLRDVPADHSPVEPPATPAGAEAKPAEDSQQQPAETATAELGATSDAAPASPEPAQAPPPQHAVGDYWGAPPPDELPELSDAMISDWPGEEPAASTSKSVSADEDQDAPGGEAVPSPEESEPFEDTPPEESPKTAPHGDPLHTPAPPDAEREDAAPAGAEVADAQVAGAEAADAQMADAQVADGHTADLGADDAQLEAEQPDTRPTPDSGQQKEEPARAVVDWPDLDWPSEVADSSLEQAPEPIGAQELRAAEARETQPGEAPQPIEAQLPDSPVLRAPDSPSVAGASASEPAAAADSSRTPPGAQLPADPPLTRLPEEAEVPPESRVAFATETMAELLLAQGRREEALQLYQQIAADRPDDFQFQERVRALLAAASEAAETRREKSPGVRRQRWGERRAISEMPADSAGSPGARPMRELLSSILAYTPPLGSEAVSAPIDGEVVDPVESAPRSRNGEPAHEAGADGGVHAPSDFGLGALSDSSDRAARTFADAGSAIGDPTRAQAMANAASAQAEPISEVLARRTPEPARDVSPPAASRRNTPRQAPTFSFDQFFRDAVAEEGTDSAGADAAPDAGGDSGTAAREEDDEDDFRAWLDGLRKS